MSILRGRDQERGDRLQALRAGSGNGHSTRRPTNVESRCGCRAESGDPRRGADVPGPGWGGFCLAVLCGGRVFHVHRTRTHPASRVCGVGCFIPITGCTSPFSFRIRTTKACHRSQQWRVVGGICGPSIRRAVHPARVWLGEKQTADFERLISLGGHAFACRLALGSTRPADRSYGCAYQDARPTGRVRGRRLVCLSARTPERAHGRCVSSSVFVSRPGLVDRNPPHGLVDVGCSAHHHEPCSTPEYGTRIRHGVTRHREMCGSLRARLPGRPRASCAMWWDTACPHGTQTRAKRSAVLVGSYAVVLPLYLAAVRPPTYHAGVNMAPSGQRLTARKRSHGGGWHAICSLAPLHAPEQFPCQLPLSAFRHSAPAERPASGSGPQAQRTSDYLEHAVGRESPDPSAAEGSLVVRGQSLAMRV